MILKFVALILGLTLGFVLFTIDTKLSKMVKENKMMVCYYAGANDYPFTTYQCQFVPRGKGW